MKKSWSWAIGLAVSAAALALALRGVRPHELADSLRGARYVYLFPALALLIAGLLTRARSWQILLGDSVPYARAFHALNQGYLLNSLLPFRLGEFGRAYLVSRGGALSSSRALSAVVVERLIDLFISAALLLATLPFALSVDWARPAAGAATVLALATLFGLWLSLVHRKRALAAADWILARVPRLRSGDWIHRANSFLDGLQSMRAGSRLPRALFWSALGWITYYFQCALLLMAFFPRPSAVTVIFLLGVLAVGAAVPASPGAVGTFEASGVAALLVFGYPQADAFSFAVVLHLINLVSTCLLGALALAREGDSLVSLAQSARAWAKPVDVRSDATRLAE